MKNPRDENYWDMLMEMCCPVFRFLSFTTFMLVAYLVIFIVEAAIGLNRMGELLEIRLSTLVRMGANWPLDIREGAVWRLITAAVLHVNFLHFFGNWATTIILLSRIEYSFGTVRSIILYLITAIGGNIFSALIQPGSIKAGASTCLYGMLGVAFGYLLINWRGLNRIGPIMKCQLICICMMIIVFTLLFTSVGPNNIDVFGHLGGFLSGLFASCICPTIENNKYEKVWRIVTLVLLVAFNAICFALFYTIIDQASFLVV